MAWYNLVNVYFNKKALTQVGAFLLLFVHFALIFECATRTFLCFLAPNPIRVFSPISYSRLRRPIGIAVLQTAALLLAFRPYTIGIAKSAVC